MAGVGIVQILIIAIILGVIIYLLRLSRAIKLEKRIGKFAIPTDVSDDYSFIDKIKIIIDFVFLLNFL